MSIWSQCVSQLKSQLSSSEFGMWIQPLQARCEEGTLEVYAPNAFVLEWVKKNYSQSILEILENFDDSNFSKISFHIGSSFTRSVNAAEANSSTSSEKIENTRPRDLAVAHLNPREKTFNGANVDTKIGTQKKLKEHHTFKTLVQGECNELAISAAKKLIRKNSGQYNPLFFYGATGLGKTHLLHAIGNEVLKKNPSAKIAYVTSERFVQNLIASLQRNGAEQFKRYYHGLDLLLIDDVQFFYRKARSQEELCHLFNRLIEDGQQIVLTADRSPQQMPVEERLRSYLGAGLSVELSAPTFETRTLILMQKALEQKVVLPIEVARWMAQSVRTNIRELEGALVRVIASAHFQSAPITEALARSVLKGVWIPKAPDVKISALQQTVADHYKISISALLGRSRRQSLVRPRQLAMSLAKELSTLSLNELGNAFGGRTHTTILHACRHITEQLQRDRALYLVWAKLRNSLI